MLIILPFFLFNFIFFFIKNAAPVRDPSNKFYVSEEQYPASAFPFYCEGPFYFMSADVARKVARMCYRFPFLKLEDVFMGACIERLVKENC